MVITHNFQDIFDVSSKFVALSLPVVKEIPLKIEFESGRDCETKYEVKEPPLPFANSDVFHASISDSRRLASSDDGCKDVYEITFDVTGSNFTYKPGDTIGIIPKNNPEDVSIILTHLGLVSKADLPYKLTVDRSLKGAKLPPHVPIQSTLRHILTHSLDLRCILKKLFILSLSKYTKDENERRVLEYLSSKEGSAKYTTHILDKNICILDLFLTFESCCPPVEVLLSYLPRLLPRPYSIVNSQMKDPNAIKICFSVMELANKRKGLVTSWLEKMISPSKTLEDHLEILKIDSGQRKLQVAIYLRINMSGFSLPHSLETPLLLIGPGTGVSPYIGFLEEREILKQCNPEMAMGKSWLFFGCRNRTLDFIYEEELKAFVENGTLNKLSAGFSREDNVECKYIQDTMKQNGKELVEFIKEGASIFICGDLKTMANQIEEIIIHCLIAHDGQKLEEAQKYIADLKKQKRYFVDAWS